jgi:thymidylate synthase (FAD)
MKLDAESVTKSRIGVLDKGFLELTDYCADDLSVVNAARVSLHKESEEFSEKDSGLIRFLMREHHGTPFEHGYFRFRVKAPLFVFREWHRHRIGHSYNEWSARYSTITPEFYIPDVVLTQVGKPGQYTFEMADEEVAQTLRKRLEDFYNVAYECYEEALRNGVAKQQARCFLPVGTYSEMIWSVNPRSLMHFLSLRNSDQAQMEIREYAKVAEAFFRDIMPVTAEAFIENNRTSP